MKTEAGVGVTQPHGQDRLAPLEAEEARGPPPQRHGFGLPTPRTVGGYISVVLMRGMFIQKANKPFVLFL